MSKSIKKNISISVILFTVIFVIISFVLSAVCIAAISYRHEEETADAAAEFAYLIIDPDEARDCLTTRSHGDDYETVLNNLIKYQQNSKLIKRISLISYSNTTGSYVYDTSGLLLGTRSDYDEYTDSVKAELINGRDSWNVRRNGFLYIYRPLRTVDDRLAGYIVVETNGSPAVRYIMFTAFGYLLLLVVSGFMIFALIAYMKKKLFIPIRQLTSASLNFSEDSSSGDLSEDNAAVFGSGRDDEIGQLGRAVRKMFLDINSGAEDLSKAIFDANHDGMTQVLNKRCYGTMEKMFTECQSICVIYFDVNNLKLMNDTLGHERGDYVIKRAAEYIKQFLGQTDYCFRMGGDEFLVVMTECTFRQIDSLIEKLDSDSPYILNRDSDSVRCALSYGYAYAKGNYSYDKLLDEAEKNMYSKKTELKKLMNMPER